MSERPTLETDAVEAWPASKLYLGNDGVVPSEFARRLERERDEAREQVNHYRDKLDLLPIKWDI